MTKSPPLVSVIMPCYNAGPYLRPAVDSVLGQTCENVELIVVDDGSIDGSLDVLRSMSDPRLTVMSQNNKGQCAACNHGYRRSEGALIKFFDADDIMEKEMIARQVERLAGRNDVIAMGEWKRFYGAVPDSATFPTLPMYRDAAPDAWLIQEWSNARPMMQCGLWLVPRILIEERGMWDERLSLINDFEFFTRILLGAKKLLYSPRARMHYRSGVLGSLSRRKGRVAIESAFLSLMLGTKHLLEVNTTVEARMACAAILQDFEFTHYPEYPDLRAQARRRVVELGGSALQPDGPPGFHKLRRFVGWRLARRAQRYAAG